MFYGWYVVSGVFISQMFVTGFMVYAFSSIVIPVQQTFDVSRDQVMLSLTVSALVGLVLSPIIGAAVDRFSARWLMSIGALIYGGGLYLLGSVESIIQFSLVFGVSLSMATLLLGPLVGTTTVSRWFNRRRGRALGIAAIGTSVGGLLVPWLFSIWLENGTWRDCVENLGVCILLTVLPYTLFMIRGRPEELSLHPDGVATPNETLVKNDDSLSTVEILRTPAFWYIGLCVSLLFAVYSGLMANLSPFAQGGGAVAADAVKLIWAVAVCGLIGKIVFGFAAESISLRLGLWLALSLVGIGLLLFIGWPSFIGMMLGSMCIGLAAGGMLPVWGAMLAQVFGVISYGKVMGYMNPMLVVFNMISPVMAGYLADKTGSYDLIFSIYIGVLILAGVLLLPLEKL